MTRFVKPFAALVVILSTVVLAYAVDPLSIQQMFQNTPTDSAPQTSGIMTVRGGTIRQLPYSALVPPVATSGTVGTVKPDGTTTTVDGNGTLHSATTYPNPGIPYSLGNSWGVPFTSSNKIPANYVALPTIPATKAPCGVGYHLDSYDASTGQFTCSADASTGGSTDYNAVHLSAAGEYAGVASKTTPDGADILMIEDSANGNTKKRISVNSLPYQAQGSYLSTGAIGSTVQPYSAALSDVTGSNHGDETQTTIKNKLGAAGPSDGYLTAAQYVTLSNALQPTSTLDATKLSGTATIPTTGNAATATKLATPRAINGVNFDGSAAITINAVDSTPRVAQTVTVNGHPLSANVTVTAADAGALAVSAQAADSAKLATVTPSANALTILGHTFSQMVNDLSTALSAAYHGLTILSSEITTALGFTPENVANKSTDGTMAANSTTLYPTQSAVRTYVAANGGGGSSAVFKVYTSSSWQTKTGYVWYRGTGDPDPTSSMGPYDILNDATATSSYTDVTSLFTGTGPCYLKSDGTCANPAGAGTVTSVAATVPAFLTVAGSPVTGNGTLAFSLTSGYYVPSTGDQTNWNTKQAALTSGSNIKTVSGVSLMGSGDVGTIGTAYGGTGATNFSFSGTAHKVASASFTTPASNKCIEVDASGNLQIAGSNAACGSGGSGLSTSLTAGNIYIGNAGGTATDTAISGDGTLSSTGALTITKSGGQSFGSNAFTSTAYLSAETDPVVKAITGIVKSNGTTIAAAVAGTDYVVPSGSITGSAAKWTTARNLAGNSTDGSANVAFANKFIVQGTTDAGLSGAQFLGSLGTGLLKNTTTTGVLSVAAAGTDYQAPLNLLPGTYTTGNLCTYNSAGTLLNCNTPTSTFQTAGTYVTSVTASNSLASSGGTTPAITLSGDSASPGASMLYGTDGSGVKGWYAQPSGGGGMSNPMTTAGDIIVGGTSGAPARLGIGANTYVLTSNGSSSSWAAPAAASLTGTIPSAVLGNSTHYIGSTAIALNRATASQSLTGITSIDGYAAGLSGGNSTTLLGSIPYQSNTNVTTMLGPNTSSTKKFLRQTGSGTNGAAPAWDTVVRADVTDFGTGVGTALGTSLGTAGGVSTTIAAGTAALGTSAISSGACATAVTATATNVATTDVINWGFNGDPTGVTGYAPTANGMLTIIAYPTSGNANFKVCNLTAASVTPGAITLNFRVNR